MKNSVHHSAECMSSVELARAVCLGHGARLKGPMGMPKPAMTLSMVYGSAPRSTSMHAACRKHVG